MCRYAFHTYKSHFACFTCRKAFKKVALDDYVEHIGLKAAYTKILAAFHSPPRRRKVEAELGISYEQLRDRYLSDVSVCPQCQGQMAAMGLDFRSPPKHDVEAWSIIQELHEHGFAFKGCGCNVGYTPPRKKIEVTEWLRRHSRKTVGEELLEAIRRKA